MEYWNIGYEKRKTDYPTRNVESTFFDDALQASIFWFLFIEITSCLQRNYAIARLNILAILPVENLP
jgi:hypothetical protein